MINWGKPLQVSRANPTQARPAASLFNVTLKIYKKIRRFLEIYIYIVLVRHRRIHVNIVKMYIQITNKTN